MRIHPFPARPRLLAVVMTLATLLLLLVPLAAYAQANTAHGFYQQTNLVSDLPNIATFQDPNLLNPWGLSHGPTTPWWVSDNGAGVATLYNGQGQAFPLASPLVVTIPPPAGSPAGTTAAPTGNVFNGTSGFVVSENGLSGPSLFMFALWHFHLCHQFPLRNRRDVQFKFSPGWFLHRLEAGEHLPAAQPVLRSFRHPEHRW